jgi:NAD(P)-dependent dehydrogenase (short-subunit alcohol dehydrogenase family)
MAIITGGASGIGRGTAELFAQEGAKVVIGDLPITDGDQLAKSIGGLFVPTDVREARAVENLVRTACDRFGGLDIKFNKSVSASCNRCSAPRKNSTRTLFASISTSSTAVSNSAAL